MKYVTLFFFLIEIQFFSFTQKEHQANKKELIGNGK